MPRRPGRPSFNRLITAAFLLIPWLVEAQQQQRPADYPRQQQHESPLENLEVDSLHMLEATRVPQVIETPLMHDRRKKTLSNHSKQIHIENDASAIATLAPAGSAVRAPPSRQSSIATAGLTTPQLARSLEDWEVEDFVLLATVDGKLHARDRKTGKEKWTLEMDQPMVQTRIYGHNRSAVEGDYRAIDNYIWIVEPSRDGSLYIYIPGGPEPGLVNTDLTMKKLVEEMVPYADDSTRVMYTGEKKTDMMTIDARSGHVLKYFGSTSKVNPKESCPRPTGFVDTENEECSPSATLTLGRTEYKVSIRAKDDGHHIAELKFAEWTPNNYDHDLYRQYHTTLDGKYVHSSHDGSILGYDHERSSKTKSGQIFQHKFPAPVVRVFDVARPWGTEQEDPELVVLPQPMPPSEWKDEVTESRRTSSIFLNHTEDGSWYAMSGKSYPLIVDGPKQARCNQQGFWQHRHSWENWSPMQLSEALVGLHWVERIGNDPVLSISPPPDEDNRIDDPLPNQTPALLDPPTFVQRLQRLPSIAVNSLLEFIKNPVLILFLIGLVMTNQRQLRTWVGHFGDKNKLGRILGDPISREYPQLDRLPKVPEDEIVEITVTQDPIKVSPVPDEVPQASNEEENAISPEAQPQVNLDKPLPEKKKAHRGRRGGVKHRKGRAASQDPSLDPPEKLRPTIEDAVREAQNMGVQTKLEPDIRTISNDPAEVSGPVIRIGALEVNTEKLIGTGSNGTMVFEGNFDGREVAVKRMLIQFFDIASQETKLLRESDDHPNVIRYFAQQQAAGFLYIALELCPASLADVIEKPQLHRDLAQGGEKDLPNVLYQITNGLQHLHNLRIVHRDLKPQNILVARGKDGKPRLLVSDFGLCKKLEGEQSSFRATTAHAAGTSGWRAPELLLDDDNKDGLGVIDASTDGNSGSVLVSSELMPNRRATRAIDIFSLGLVFFYVLTKGSHPFDCGDRYMREVNIRKGNFNLRLLEVLGDYAYEAKDLISSMLAPEPKLRPQARQVMAHPFFWSAKKRLNFLCDVSDHFEKEIREPPSPALQELERWAPEICHGDFLKPLGKEFVESLGKQRKYTGTRLLDLLRALRNKKNHYEDMSDKLKKDVGPLPNGYLSFWTRKFPNLLISCWNIVYDVQWEETDRFREYYLPAGL